MTPPLARWIERRALGWWHAIHQRYLPTPRIAAQRTREDGKAEFEVIGRLRPILADAAATYVRLVQRSAGNGMTDEILIEAAASAGAAASALRLIEPPMLQFPPRQAYMAGVMAYADGLIGAIQRQVVICRQLWTARSTQDLATELLLSAAQDQLLIGLLEQENVFQHAAAYAIRPANPQYFLTRSREALNTGMIHLLERAATVADPLAPPHLALARRAIADAEALLRKAAASAPRYYDWLRRHEDASGMVSLAPMRTALAALRSGLEDSIATEQAIASGVRALTDALDGAPSLAVRLGHAPHAHATIAELVARRLSAPGAVRNS
jgi:hypothetical protein